MCKDCGCSTQNDNFVINADRKNSKTVNVLSKILGKNDVQADENRMHFQNYNILAVNLMSSPGAGKTLLLEKTIEILKDRIKIGVIEGDLETSKDADRIKAKGVPAYQITTGKACHLDAFMVHEGIHNLPLEELDMVFIENVGNLVCPASFDVGSHLNVVLLSIPEGDDKPAKYPVIFDRADAVLITKVDLLPYIDFDVENAEKEIRKINPKANIIILSAKTSEGIDRWINYILDKKEKLKISGTLRR